MKKDYPLWLTLALKLPLKWKHWIREQLIIAESWSHVLVIEDEQELCELIENTSKPDFVKFNSRLDEIRKVWGKNDSHIEAYATRGRLRMVLCEQNIKSISIDLITPESKDICKNWSQKTQDQSLVIPCDCQDPRTVWNGTLKQWICDDCKKPVNKGENNDTL